MNLTQGSPEWFARRLLGVGASEAPIVMGESRRQTPHGLWRIKRGLDKEPESTWVMRKGQYEEARARRDYEAQTGVKMPAAFLVHPTRPHMFASLDGFNQGARRLIEIKYAGRDDHELARLGHMPPKHRAQLQHQLAVTGFEEAHYFSWNGKTGHIVTVVQDLTYQGLLTAKVDQFWQLVMSSLDPELIDLDFELMRKSPDPERRAEFLKWRASKIIAERAECSLESIYRFRSAAPFRHQPRAKGLTRMILSRCRKKVS